MYRIVIWQTVSLCASSEVITMKINTDTIVKIKIVNLLKESGMEPIDAIMCLHSLESSMLKVIRDMISKDDDESEDEDE